MGKAACGHEELPASLAKDCFGVLLLYLLSSHPEASFSMPARWQSQIPVRSPKSPVANVQNKEAVFGVPAVPASIRVPVTFSSNCEKAYVALVMVSNMEMLLHCCS